ncbi:MAG: hypothetical protein HC927_03365 [Deltaproteobacteria bacterium]|nr:hypothetical protein [Deltaproteobacteria bacterium]
MTAGGGKMIGFEFDDPSWPTYVERAANSGSLKVAEFALTAPDGQPLTGPLDPKAIHYSIALEGLGSNLREHHVTIDKVVMDAKGTQVYRQREPDDIRFPEAEIGSSGGRLTGSVAVPGPGTYELELKIVDLVGGESIVHRHEFVIE